MNNKTKIGMMGILLAIGMFSLPLVLGQFTDSNRTRAVILNYGGVIESPTNPEFNITTEMFVVYGQCTRSLTSSPQRASIDFDINLSQPSQYNTTIKNAVIDYGHTIGCDLKNENKVGDLS